MTDAGKPPHDQYMLLHRIVGNVVGLMCGLEGKKKAVASMIIDRLYELERLMQDTDGNEHATDEEKQ